MSSVIKGPKDFWKGVAYLSFGAIAYWIARDYSFGSASRMGAGYFPTMLSGLLMLLGLLAVLRGVTRPGAPLGAFAWKPALVITASTLAFGVLLMRAGLIVALLVLIMGSASASSKFRFEWQVVFMALGLIVFCVLVFVTGLGLPMPLLGSWFGG